MAKPPKNQPQEGGSSQPPQRAGSDAEVTHPFYGMRSRALAWRSQWFARSRSADEVSLTKARDTAFGRKLKLIDGAARKSGWKAGYDPAGAGSPWYPYAALYQLRLEGSVASWLGDHKDKGAGGVEFQFRIDAIPPVAVPPSD